MTRDMYMTMMEGLVATIKEMALVGGQDDRVRELVDIVADLQEFWNGDEEFTRFDYNISAEAAGQAMKSVLIAIRVPEAVKKKRNRKQRSWDI